MSPPLSVNPSPPAEAAVPATVRSIDGRAKPGIRLAALRLPLVVKLVGANAAVVVALVARWRFAGGQTGAALALVAGVVGAHLILVLIALRPIRDLETVAARVWSGDFGARVAKSGVADSQVLRVGSMFNILLDAMASDSARMRTVTTELIAAGERERAALARELHDSTAQEVAALLLQLAAAARDESDPALAARLRAARDAAEGILEEVRQLSHAVHPVVLDALGLEAALRRLARETSRDTGINIEVNTDRVSRRLQVGVEGALYRVAEEAVRNATRHASPSRVRIDLDVRRSEVTLDVHDDGRGFDLADVDRRRTGVGLLSMRERIALVDGRLDIRTAEGNGTTVSATVPLDPTPDTKHEEVR
jgi:signal transduction histidine kinase